MVGVSCSVVVVWVILIISSSLPVLGRCGLCVVCGTIKIVGIFLQTKEKYADLLKGSFFISRRMWCLKRDTRKNALLRLLAWTRTEGGRASCFIIPSPLYYRFPIFLRASVPAAFGFLRSALFCCTYFHAFTASSLSLSERPTYLYSPFWGSKLIGWGK